MSDQQSRLESVPDKLAADVVPGEADPEAPDSRTSKYTWSERDVEIKEAS